MNLPLKCVLGETCFIQQYVDTDQSENARDFTCGPLSYDGHKGTDFALNDTSIMEQGVAVLAAAPGIVIARRDDEPDTGAAGASPGKECGNGVVLDHGDGWVTQYCHLKNGSIGVAVGQKVPVGGRLGMVGLSGQTEFPHLHLSLRRHDKVIDPFAPGGEASCGAPAASSLWAQDILYRSGGLVSIGLTDTVPEFVAVKEGSISNLQPSPETPALVIYAHIYGVREGDRLAIMLTGPNGAVFDQTMTLDRTQARSFRAYGRKRPAAGWQSGDYDGRAVLLREGNKISKKELRFSIR